MKKLFSILLATVMLVSLCACGGTSSSSVSMEELYGEWHNREGKQILRLGPNEAKIIKYPSGGAASHEVPKIDGGKLKAGSISTLSIEKTEHGIPLVDTGEGRYIAQGTVFVREENIATIEEITAHTWVNIETGNKLLFEGDKYTHRFANGSGNSGYINTMNVIGDMLYIPYNVDAFQIVFDGDSMHLIGEERGLYITQEAADIILDSQKIKGNIGDTVSARAAKMTVKEITFPEYMGKENTSLLFNRDYGWEHAGDGMVFARIVLDYTNLEKKTIRLHEFMKVSVDYNNGYLYSTEDSNTYCFNSEGIFYRYGLSSGYVMDHASLASDEYVIFIPIAAVAAEDTASPMKLIFEFEGEAGPETVEYTVR